MQWDETILIGSGGCRPGLHLLPSDDAKIDRVLSVPMGHSVYALGRVQDGVVLGTKRGEVQRVQQDEAGAWHAEVLVPSGSRNAAPVLSVCATAKNGVVVADSAGTCQVIDVNGHESPYLLPTEGRTICSVVGVSELGVAGLSTDGVVCLWDLTDGRIVDRRYGPAPPRFAALVEMVYVPTSNALFYPARLGGLAMLAVADSALCVRPAHDGGWYGLARGLRGLITAGWKDGRLLLWSDDHNEPAACIACPLGILSVAVMNEEATRLLLVFHDGNAGMYQLHDGTMERIATVPGHDYRVAVGSMPERLRAHRLQVNRARAEAVVHEIVNASPQDDATVVGGLHQELSRSGYGHVSLSLLAQEAERNGDHHAELLYRLRLSDSLPAGDARTCHSLERYGVVLEELWQIREAVRTYERLLAIQGDTSCAGRLAGLQAYMENMTRSMWIAAPGRPLHDIIYATSTLGNMFTGRWVLQPVRAMYCPGVCLTTGEWCEEIENNAPHAFRGSVNVSVEEVVWLSDKQFERIRILCLRTVSGDDPSLQLCCKVINNGAQSAVLPYLVLEAGGGNADVGPQGHNASVLQCAMKYQDDPFLVSWVSSTWNHMRVLLREAVTQRNV